MNTLVDFPRRSEKTEEFDQETQNYVIFPLEFLVIIQYLLWKIANDRVNRADSLWIMTAIPKL